MNVERVRTIERLFWAARELAPDQRESLLRESCAHDESIRREVEELLACDSQHSTFMDKPAAEVDLQALADDLRVATGSAATGERSLWHEERQIGPYVILEQIGEGAFGIVYRAEQRAPLKRQVALKIVKPGMDSRQVVARFEAERQALAVLDHPNVAKIFDGGVSERGRPYFVMELVRGVPITDFCDRERLTTPQRLRLFATVCDAVQHAHQKGVLHRDLKPSNILVELIDGEPSPKVIDFGIAKALGQRLTERTLVTERGMLIGTPEYMSPEQAEMSGLDVDTRSDVYSLGVILYQLLAGSLPVDPRNLRTGSMEDVQRRIRALDPVKPSTRLGAHADREAIAACRRAEARMLLRSLRGELDWITMKAMEKERSRRYAGASELAADIRRHLANEPVVAGPPTVTYRLRKFVRRNRAIVAAGAALFAALAIGAMVASVLAVRAEREHQRAERVSAFLQQVIGGADPFVLEPYGGEDSVTARLDYAAERVGEALRDSPRSRIEVRTTLAQAYHGLGADEPAERQAALAMDEAAAVFGDDHALTIGAMNVRVLALRGLDRAPEALGFAEDGLARAMRTLGRDDPLTLTCANNLALLLKEAGQYDAALRLYHDTFERRRRVLGGEHEHTLFSQTNLARLLHDRGRLAEAESLLREALAAHRQHYGDEHPHTLITMDQLGAVLRDAGRLDEAAALHEQALAGFRRTLGETHADTLGARFMLANLYIRQQRLADAETSLRDLLDDCRSAMGERHQYTFMVINALADALRRQRTFDEVEAIVGAALPMMIEQGGSDAPYVLSARSQLGRALLDAGRFAEAAETLRQAHEGAVRLVGEDDPRTAALGVYLGLALLPGDRGDEAERLLRRHVDALSGAQAADREALTSGAAALAEICERRGSGDEAARYRRLASAAAAAAEPLTGSDQR